jgi:hypothetical protein
MQHHRKLARQGRSGMLETHPLGQRVTSVKVVEFWGVAEAAMGQAAFGVVRSGCSSARGKASSAMPSICM